jgi:hypothetical protein
MSPPYVSSSGEEENACEKKEKEKKEKKRKYEKFSVA